MWLLDLANMSWALPTLSGRPRCVGGRAGHGALFVPRRAVDGGSSAGGELLLLSGAMRSSSGDSHQMSVDAIEVEVEARHAARADGANADRAKSDALAPDKAARHDALAEEAAPSATAAGRTLRLWWSEDVRWARLQLPPVRTAWYASCGRSLLVWSGVSERHGLGEALHVVDVDRRSVREVADDPSGMDNRPTPRGGAVCWPLSEHEALMFSGSSHDDGWETLHPWVLSVTLP